MFKGGGWFMYVILAVIVLAMLRNAAGAVGIILAGSSGGTGLINALSGANDTKRASSGTFSSGGTSIKLG
jgi:hypothetical protein